MQWPRHRLNTKEWKTVRNSCTKSKSFPEKADHSWNPLTRAVVPQYFQMPPYVNFWQKIIFGHNEWITNFSLFPKFGKFIHISTFHFYKKEKQWSPSYSHSIASSGLMPSTSIKYLTKQHKNQVCCRKGLILLTGIDINILRKYRTSNPIIIKEWHTMITKSLILRMQGWANFRKSINKITYINTTIYLIKE